MTNMSNTTTVRFHMGGESDIKTAHNRRDEATVKWEKHIDMERKHIVLKDMELEEAYAELFGEAIEEYDAKQKRRDRKIGGVREYMEQVRKHIVLKDMELEEAYAELFGEAIEEYDAKQKRRDRKIGGVREYMEQVRADARGRVNKKTREKGKNLAYEVIVGIGSVKPVVDSCSARLSRSTTPSRSAATVKSAESESTWSRCALMPEAGSIKRPVRRAKTSHTRLSSVSAV